MKTHITRFSNTLLALTGSVILTTQLTQAATYYWDTNGTASGLGNTSGTWGSTAYFRALAAGDVRGVIDGTLGTFATQNGASGDTFYFGTVNMSLGATASTIGTTGSLTATNLVIGAGQTSNITFSAGGTITLAGTTPTIAVNTTTANTTIAATLSGTVGMTKAGAGTLILTGTNGISGGITIRDGGTLQIGNGTAGSLTSSNALTFNNGGGTFNVQEAAGSTQAMGALTFSAGDGTVQSTWAGSGVSTLSFASLAARGAGATGNFIVSGGINGTDNRIVLTGATTGTLLDRGFFFDGSSYAAYDASGFVRAYGSGDANYLAAPTGATIGASTSADNVQLTTGNITAQTSASANTINMGANSITMSGTGELLQTNGLLSSGSPSATLGGGTNSLLQSATAGGEMVIRVNGASDQLTISSGIQNNTSASALTKSGAGTLVLSGSNTYTGATRINAGTLAVSGGSALEDAGAVSLANTTGATLRLDGNETIGNLSGGGLFGGNVNVQGNTLTLSDNTSTTFGGTFSGTGSGVIVKQGSGTLTLSNKNTFAGSITLNAGTLLFTYGNDGSSSAQSLSSGGAINMAGGTGLTFQPLPSATSGLYDGNNPAQLSAPNGWTIGNAINITSGTATFRFHQNGNRWNFTGGVTGGTSGSQTLNILQGTPSGGSGDAQDILFSGILANGSGGTLGVSVDFTASSGTAQSAFVNLSGQNTFTGDITVANTRGLTSGAYLTIGGERTATGTLTTGSGYLGGGNYSGSISLATGAILNYASSAAQTLGGVISGNGSLQKDGNGTLTLSAANTYRGTTTVNTGILNVNSTNALGDGSVTNTLIFNGGTLQAGGTITSLATRGVTMTGAGTIDTNSNAVSIAGIISGTGALTKSGIGTLTLSAANTYTGDTLVSAGNIVIGNALALQNSAYVTTSVAGGLNVTGFTTPTLGGLSGAVNLTTTLITGYSSISSLTLNPQFGITKTYSGDVGNGNGSMSLTKTGAGTQILSGANTYTGGTTISGGALQLGAGGTTGTLSTTGAIVNNGAFTVNRSNAVAQGTDFNGAAISGIGSFNQSGAGTTTLLAVNTYTGSTNITAGALTIGGSGSLGSGTYAGAIGNAGTLNYSSSANQTLSGIITGTGVLVKNTGGSSILTLSGVNTFTGTTTVSAGTIAITNALALQNSAYNTTGSNGSTTGLDVTSGLSSGKLTLGGLSGSVDLASAFTAGFTGTVTNLTLNPQSGITSTYGGVIDNTTMSLTKTGAGTQTLTGANLYTGATSVNSGTLNLGGGTATGSLSSTVLNLGGGTLSYTRTGTNTQTFTTTNITAGVNTISNSVAGNTLALGSIVRTVGGTVNFSNAGTITTTTGLTNSIIGGWATINNDNWATKTGANITALGVYTVANATAATNLNTNMDATTVTIGGVINTNSIRFSGSGVKTLTLAAGDNIIQSGGILVRSDVGNNLSTITGGNLLGSSGGDLIIHQYNASNGLTIASLIKDNGTATALTKSGSGTLTLTNSSNSYSGGTFINGGTLAISSDGNLGATSGGITFNGSSQLNIDSGVIIGASRTLTINDSASVTFAQGTNGGKGIAGVLTGSGSITWGTTTDIWFSNTANTFNGVINITGTGSGGTSPGGYYGFGISSIGDAAGAGLINMSGGTALFSWRGKSGTTTLSNRQFNILGSATIVAAGGSGSLLTGGDWVHNAANNLIINTDLLVTGAGAKTLTLRGLNTGANTFAGKIADGASSVVSLTKADAGTWILSGTNSYSGATTISAGTLQLGAGGTTGTLSTSSAITLSGGIFAINRSNAVAQGTDFSGAILAGAGGFAQMGAGTTTLNVANTFTGATTVTAGTLALTDNLALQNSALTFSAGSQLDLSGAATPTIGGLNSSVNLALVTGYNTAVTALTLNPATGVTATYSGSISNTVGDPTLTLTKSGAGIQVLSGNNSFSGGLVVNAGTVRLSGTQGFTGGVTLNGGNLGDNTDGISAAELNNNSVTVNGTAAFAITSGETLTSSSGILINSLGNLSLGTTGSATVSGVVSGSGILTVPSVVGNGGGATLTLSNTANTFTGGIVFAPTANGVYNLNVNSLADSLSSGAGNIVFTVNGAVASALNFNYTGATPLTFTNRQFEIQGPTASGQTVKIANNSSQAFIINSNLNASTATGVRTLTLGGTGAGLSAFGGTITNGGLTTLNLTKADANNTWVLSNAASSYNGVTTVTAGTLQVSKLDDGLSNSSIGASSNLAANLVLNGGTLRYAGGAQNTDRLFSLQVSSSLDASGTGAVNFTNTGSMGFNGGTAAKTLTLTGTNTGNNILAAAIANNTGATSIAKTGVGTWVLSGSNTATGTSSISGGGTLVLDYATAASKLSSGILTLSGGNITLKGGSYTQAVASTTINLGGHTHIAHDGGTSKIAFGAITRSSSGGATVSLEDDTIATTTSVVVNGILSGGIFVGDNYAKVSGGNIVALVSGDYTALPTGSGATTATVNYQLTGGLTRTAGMSLNSLRITGSGVTDQVLDLGTFNLQPSLLSDAGTPPVGRYVGNSATGGILYTGGGTGNYTITGTGTSQISAQNNNQELIINTYAGTLNIDVPLNMTAAPLTKTGAGTLELRKASNYTGTTWVNQGVVRLRNATAAGTATNTLNAGIVVQNNAALELANNITVGTEALTITGTGVSNAGALRNVASNSSIYQGAITLGAGGARINSDASGALTLTGGVVTSLFNNVTLGGAGNTTVSTTAISGAGGLIKDGAGITTLSATNTYTGATTVSQGTLLVTGSILTSSLVSVSSGATLGGGGTVGALSFDGGALFDLALAIGGNDLTASTINFATAGFGIDNLVFNGSAVDWSTIIDGTYTLIGGTLDSTNLANFGIGSAYDIGSGRSAYFQNGSLQLVVETIPEPKTALLGVLGVLLLLRRRRQ